MLCTQKAQKLLAQPVDSCYLRVIRWWSVTVAALHACQPHKVQHVMHASQGLIIIMHASSQAAGGGCTAQ
jgi:hypothetical protein